MPIGRPRKRLGGWCNSSRSVSPCGELPIIRSYTNWLLSLQDDHISNCFTSNVNKHPIDQNTKVVLKAPVYGFQALLNFNAAQVGRFKGWPLLPPLHGLLCLRPTDTGTCPYNHHPPSPQSQPMLQGADCRVPRMSVFYLVLVKIFELLDWKIETRQHASSSI